MRIKLRTAGLDDLTSIYAIRRDSILGVPSEASLSDSPEKRLRQRQAWADKRSPNYYQDLGISEYWIVNVKTCEIIAFAIPAIGTSQRIMTSQAIPELAFSLLESTLKLCRQNNQSAALAWFNRQIQL